MTKNPIQFIDILLVKEKHNLDLTYGVMTLLTAGNHRIAILSTGLFFVLGLVLLARHDMPHGMAAADAPSPYAAA